MAQQPGGLVLLDESMYSTMNIPTSRNQTNAYGRRQSVDSRSEHSVQSSESNQTGPSFTSTNRTDFTSNNNGDGHFTMGSPQANYLLYNQDQDERLGGGESPVIESRNHISIDKYPRINLIGIIVALILGTIFGIMLSYFEVRKIIIQWIKVPGDMFVRAVDCVVIPMVFIRVAVAVAELIEGGKGRSIALRMVAFITLLSLLAALEGVGMGMLSREFFSNQKKEVPESDVVFRLKCSNGLYLNTTENGQATCSAEKPTPGSEFLVKDVGNLLLKAQGQYPTGTSISSSLIKVFKIVVPENILKPLMDNAILSVALFSIPFGVAMKRSFQGQDTSTNPLLEFLREINDALMLAAKYILLFTPYAVVSLLAGSLQIDVRTHEIWYPVAMLAVFLVSTVMIHMFVISPLVYFIFTRKNPFKLIAAMIPAYIYALGCSSSMATLPWTSQCLETTRAARRPLINCVTSITSILHMNGTAIYLSLAMFFLVDRSGHSSSIGAFQIFMVVLGSFLGSFLTAPIPGGSVITLITIWGIVMPEMQVPEVYVHLIAVDVILDRFITMANIHGDMIITSIIAEQIHDKPTEYQF